MKYDICIAVGVYDKLGGVSRYNVELTGALAKAGHRVSIVATVVGYQTENLERVIPVRTNFFLPALNFFASAVKVARIYRRFKKEHPEGLFITDGLPSFASDFMIAQSVHGQAVIVTNAREPKNLKGWIRRFLRTIRPMNIVIIFIEWFSVRFGTKRVVAIAEKVKREIVALYHPDPGRIIVVHSGVNANEFAPNPEVRTRIRTEMGFADDDFVFLFSGNEFKRKGLAYAIAALASLHNEKAKLVVAGRAKDDAFKEIAQNHGVADKVFFIGSRSDFADWCAASDAFLFPTLDEPFGLVIAEALAAGLPVITSGPHYAGAAECMKHGFDSLLLDDPTDVPLMASYMQEIMDDKTFREELATNGRKTAEGLSWERVAGEITTI
jgi:glycosyltransferase involved in cell wall biosynthesis